MHHYNRTSRVYAVWIYHSKAPILIPTTSASPQPLIVVLITFVNHLYAKLAVTLVTLGVVLTTLSRPSSPRPSSSVHATLHEPKQKYRVGVSLLSASLLLTAALGVMQERTYAKYGPCWREGVFYTVRL